MAEALTRRRFLELVTAGVAGGLAGALAGCEDTLRASFGRASMTAVPTGPRKVAALAALSDTPTAFPFITTNGGDGVYAYLDGEQVVVLSNVCTHRGCAVNWQDAQARFACPCHEGYFDRAGQVISGPPLGPLASYPAELRGGDVYVLG